MTEDVPVPLDKIPPALRDQPSASQAPAAAPPAQAAEQPVPIDKIPIELRTAGEQPESHDDWHVVKSAARGFSRVWGDFTGETESQQQARTAAWGLAPPKEPTTADTVAEFIGGMGGPPATKAGEVVSYAASRAADKAAGTLGMKSGSEALQHIERSLARLPGGGALRRAVKQQNEQFGNRSEELVQRLAGGEDVSKGGVGKMLDTQIGKIAAARLKSEAREDYDILDKFIKPDDKIGVKATLATLRELTTEIPGAEATSRPLIDKTLLEIREGLEKDVQTQTMDALPYGAAAKVRTKLRGLIDWTNFSTDSRNGQLRQAYNALTSDMASGAAEINPAAKAAKLQADAAYVLNKKTQETLRREIEKAGGGEKFFQSVINGTKDIGSMTTVVNELDEPNRMILAAGILERLGKAAPNAQNVEGDVFSASSFLTNWNKMSRSSPEIRDLIFGKLPGDYNKSITQLAANVEVLKNYEGVLANPSGTAHGALWGGAVASTLTFLVTGHWEAAAGIVGTAAANAVLNTALTNPSTTAWLAKETSKIVIAAAKGQLGTSKHPLSDEYKRAVISGQLMQEPIEQYEEGVGEALGQF